MRERNRLAREYSRRCRTRRMCKVLWVAALVLWAALLAIAAWAISLPKPEPEPPPAPVVMAAPVAAPLEEPEPENLLVCTITGYCACCTPYSHMNQKGGLVLTASGQWVAVGEAVAVDPDIIPLGSKVTLGGKTYIAADTGVKGYVVDVLMSHEDAAVAGAERVLVKWE